MLITPLPLTPYPQMGDTGKPPPDPGPTTGPTTPSTATPRENQSHMDRAKDNHGKADGVPRSYAERLKTNVRYDQRLKRNVLEIILDKHEDVEVDLDQNCIAKLCKSIGIDIANQVEGYQIKGKTISVWLAQGINLERFCKEESIKVAKGISTSFIRPAGRTDVTVSVTGIDFNTPDTFIIEYLNKFGSVVDNNVIYLKYKEGPFKGKYTGERRYQADFSKSRKSMGTYHFIDGARVRIFYRGNIKTCARCHQMASVCPGQGKAKDCELKSGPKINLFDHMRNLWSEVGFIPSSFTLSTCENEDDSLNERMFDAPLKSTGNFAPKIDKPKPTEKDIEKYEGITIRNFNPKVDNKEILAFLHSNGLPNDTSLSSLLFTRSVKNTSVTIESISSETVQNLMKLHFPTSEKKFFDLPIYCRAIRNLTPDKPTEIASNLAADALKVNPVEPAPIASTSDANVNPEVPVQNAGMNSSFDHIRSIPGLDRETQLHPFMKPKKKKMKTSSQIKKIKKPGQAKNLKKEDFLHNPLEKKSETDDFEFSEYSSDNSDEEEDFEDSKENLSETDAMFTLTPSQLPFSEKLAAANKISAQNETGKRQASSPASQLNVKKPKPKLN